MERILVTRIILVLAVLTLLAAPGCGPGYSVQEGTVVTVSAIEATATAAVADATVVAVSQQQTIESARTKLEADYLAATQQVEATVRAAGTLSAIALQLTTQAQATADTQVDLAQLAQQLTAEAQLAATDQALRAVATEQAINQAATATELASDLSSTAQALAFQATMTAVSNAAARSAFEAAAERRRQLFSIAAAFLATLLVITAIIGIVTVSRRYAANGEPAEHPARNSVRPRVLQQSPCPPLTVRPDGTVEIPVLHDPSHTECVMSADQLQSVLQWAGTRSPAAAQRPVPPPSAPVAPGLRTIRTMRRLDQAVRVRAISPNMARILNADWRRGLADG